MARPTHEDLKLNLNLHSALSAVWDKFGELMKEQLTGRCGLEEQQIAWLLVDCDPANRQQEHTVAIEADQRAITLAIDQSGKYRPISPTEHG